MDEMDDETEDKKMLNREAMMHNMSAIDGCRSYLTIFAGVGAGILGLTSVRARSASWPPTSPSPSRWGGKERQR